MASIWSLEPRLATLLKEAESYPKKNPGFCATDVWYGYECIGLKERLVRLVGWGRLGEDKVLGLSEAYDEAYDRIYQALPDCQHKNKASCF